MDAIRRADLTAALQHHLAQATAGYSLGSSGRLEWLAHQLGLHVGRLSGFASVANADLRALVASDLFGAVEIGADAIEAELRTMAQPSDAPALWAAVRAGVEFVRQSSNTKAIEDLRLAIERWHTSLAETAA